MASFPSLEIVDIVVMAAFAWCGPNQLDAYKVLELLPIRGRWNNLMRKPLKDVLLIHYELCHGLLPIT
jgi:hypothetical protein